MKREKERDVPPIELLTKERIPSTLWSEETPFSDLQHSLNRLLGEFAERNAWMPPTWFGAAQPRVNVHADHECVYVAMEMPGLKQKDLKVMLEGNHLTVQCDKKPEEIEGRTWYRREWSPGKFRRVISIPSEVDRDKVQAELCDGVLQVMLPRRIDPKLKPRDIPVKAIK